MVELRICAEEVHSRIEKKSKKVTSLLLAKNTRVTNRMTDKKLRTFPSTAAMRQKIGTKLYMNSVPPRPYHIRPILSALYRASENLGILPHHGICL